MKYVVKDSDFSGSLSARRAWIEIEAPSSAPYAELRVALRKESVDRNTLPMGSVDHGPQSLSARRAWIEIISVRGHGFWPRVALRKESVDRNKMSQIAGMYEVGSLSARRAWIEMTQFVPITTSDVWSLSARRAWIEIHRPSTSFTQYSSRSPQGERG